ncbi:phage terminase large subunit family protein [Bradyrhizobium macuxiense]|uniref:phage terminase large subunit family protein n=1 Tax=Bradyrhizobium macuxiense TaxID=1755647 RepID=UPI0009E72A41|nr:terminase gpA endonuclease subunit [Bradyrhizobium macuxiense]
MNREIISAITEACEVCKAPEHLNLVEWSERYRYVPAKTSVSPGLWRTSAQPCCYGMMLAVTDDRNHTITIMSATQVVKSELLINTALYHMHHESAAVLFVQPTQSSAESFSKERLAPSIESSPELRALFDTGAHNSDCTIQHKSYPGGALDLVGANSPTDLASRPKRIILCDEIDKYPVSAGAEGDPLKLAEERASTYKAVGRAKFVRTCSPTVKNESRIGREYAASDQRRLYIQCPHCFEHQTLSWANMRWSKDEAGEHLPDTAAISCGVCGVLWTERERIAALDELATASDHGWRQTAEFSCCGEKQTPVVWNAEGRSLCQHCEQPSPYAGHAGFCVSKLYSKRHSLSDIVREFLEAQGDPELLRKWTNTALCELWEVKCGDGLNEASLLQRAEHYDGNSLPECVICVTGFADVQDDRLEVQLVSWGAEEEAWPFKYEILFGDPAQPTVWHDLDELLREKFSTISGRPLTIAAFGIDTGGHHAASVFEFCNQHRGRRVFACKGQAGARPIWTKLPTKSNTGFPLWLIGVDAAKESIYAKLKITAPEPGERKAGFIHFPTNAEEFGPRYFKGLNSERRVTRKRMGQTYSVWEKVVERNEPLDTLVGALAVRKSLPGFIRQATEIRTVAPPAPTTPAAPVRPTPKPLVIERHDEDDGSIHSAFTQPQPQRHPGWFKPRSGGWMRRQ